MSLFFNKKSIVIIVMTLFITIMAGCSNSSKPSGDAANDGKNSSETSESSEDKNSKSDAPSENSNVETSNTENNEQKAVLDNIKKLSEEGKIINCDFPVKTSTLQDIEKKWGKADKSDWVGEAKGNYATYSSRNVVFGTNKGDQVFEVRSFDSQLKQISLSDVKDFFGQPDHDVTSNGERIIGYKSGSEFKILFVFKDSGNDPKLDHYSVLYPSGTKNNMSGDKGREW
ncbi:YjgB family protein [Clostridium beijerinckii]|uniref:DUF4309 domain-containing protein n=2 Tax=Clostridium beijerinckii TaxID=1520 RepID=A0A0B5QQW5_CLOBE|nr:YjgB family protein [Clostridium beijerinckii]AJH00413.1 hypothetical protein LF65_03861 [Clostridium beijerinckii]AQS06141.1 hypothetical protein CLBIJ_35840 [Clostridium beijerinckii]MBA2886178.1 hypothetical protein [Clostridium beijerinckii]MBA2900964.1 hypothetical protein [Clostridium beijerinckii]MBA2910737.1 hypothetical protein [Clostridium beijerinckii]